MIEYKLDVLMITYNHQDYIKEAINGVINQKTRFKYRLLIFDDCSTDKTEERIRECLNHSNSNLTILYHRNSVNLGMIANGKQSFEAIKSTYVALCEGDDYWIDFYKLQKQIDFLEENIDYSMCFHNATESMNGKLKKMTFCQHINKQTLSLEDFMFRHIVPTASIVFRNNLEFPEWSKNVHSGDKLIILLNAIKGKIMYFDEIMCHYNVTDNGVSRSIEHRGLNKVYNMSYLYSKLDEYTNFKYKEILKRGLNYEINVHLLEPYRKELKTSLLIKEIFIRILIKWFKYKRKS